MSAPGELNEALDMVRAKIIRKMEEEKLCCARGGSPEPIEVESLDELLNYIENCNSVLVSFYSPTCPYCRAFEPIYREYAKILGKKIPFLRVNTWILPEAAELFGVMGVPMTFGVARKKVAAVIYGYGGPEQVEELIKETVESAGCEEAIVPEA